MSYVALDSAVMKPRAIVQFEIAQEHSRAKRMLVGAIISAAMIVVLAAMFINMVQ